MRSVASANRSRPPSEQPVFAELADPARLDPALVREARRGGANEALVEAERRRESIKLPRAMVPPRGMIESPKMVTISDPARSGRWPPEALDEFRGGAGGAVGWCRRKPQYAPVYDTKAIDLSQFTCQWIAARSVATAGWEAACTRKRSMFRAPDAAAPADESALERRFQARVDTRREDRAEGLDAGRLPRHADPADLAARAFRRSSACCRRATGSRARRPCCASRF